MLKVLQIFLFLLMPVLVHGAEPEAGVDAAARALHGVSEVDSLLAENLYEKAVVVARSHYQSFQDDPYWNYQFENRLAVALLRAGLPGEALPLLEGWVISRPSEARGHRNLGACLLALGKRGRALSEYQQAVELEPRNAIARLEYGQVLLEFRLFEKAGKEIQTAASLCENCFEVQSVLAQYFQAVNEPGKAVPHWKVVWDETRNPMARLNLLKALLDSHQDQAALDFLGQSPVLDLTQVELQQLVAVEGRLAVTHQSLIFARLLQDKKSAMEIPVSVADDPVFWGQVSHNLLIAGYHGEALAAVDKAIALSPTEVVYLNNRVVLLQKLGRHEEANREWEKIVLIHPSLKGPQDK